MTVLFCDLVDSTALARQFDPEDYRAVVQAYQEATVTAIQPWDGYVAQYLGDGLLLYFGWPQAREDAAVRAVYASLALVDAMGPLNARLQPQYGVRVAVRCGLHTGMAVIGTMGSGARQEQLAMGDTPNIAARLQGLATPDTVALSATTARLAQGTFALAARGTHSLKGVAEPMAVFDVLGPLAAPDDETAAGPAPAPFLVGRDEEVVPLLATLLSVPLGERYAVPSLTPQHQKQQTLDALVAWLLAEAERQPVLALWEDLHWADPSTLELLGLLIDQAPTVPMLHVLTFRPTFVPPWPSRSHLTPITLNRLERPQVEALVTRLAGGKALPAEVAQHIVAKTDGVPLFVEELTKMLLESSLLRAEVDHYALTGPLSAVTIPATLQDSLMARLDRLPPAREVAQLGAVLGREFAYEVLRAISPLDEATLQARLGQLVAAKLLYQRGRPPRATYIFKHALIQDAAYASLLKSTRQHYHQQIAQLFETRYPETAATQPELLAHHYTEAGCPAPAVAYWQQAGERAIERSANQEAVRHLTQGLEVLAALPDTPERAQQALTLHLTLGPALMNTRGSGAPEVERVYVRACELGRQLEDTWKLFPALWGLWYAHMSGGKLLRARTLGEELFGLAQQLQDPVLTLEAHRALGNTLLWLGEVGLAYTHVEQGLVLYDPQQMRSHAVRYGQDSGVTCRLFGAMSLCLLGYPDQAQQWSEAALTHAEGLRHAFTLAQALLFSALIHQLRREPQAAQALAEAQLALCTEQGFAQYHAWGLLPRGWAIAVQGQTAEGIAQIRQGFAAWQAKGARVCLPWMLALLAEACGRAGQVEEGLRALREALELMQTTQDRVYEAEVYRLQGELLLQQSPGQQAGPVERGALCGPWGRGWRQRVLSGQRPG